MSHVIILMGVSGSGKTAIGLQLAARLGLPFYDGDDFQPPENIAKMASGIPLEDADRIPWLERLRGLIHDHLERAAPAILACSALTQRYRELLRGGSARVQFVYLQGDFELIWDRMQQRQGHYMKASMLRSQFDTLEAPGWDEAIPINVANPIEAILDQIILQLKAREIC